MTNSENDSDNFERYSRQMKFAEMGEPAQERLAKSSVLLVGCGALGCAIANSLVRAGVGRLRIVDRDWVELSNLQRQSLFNEADVASELPKSIAAAEHLRNINSQIEIEPLVADFNFENAKSLIEGCDLILDGTDNFEARFLMNDCSIKYSIPWVYGGCLGCEGQTMTIIPDQTPCLNCVMLDGPPAPGTTATCDTAGILEPIISLTAAVQTLEAIKILSGNLDAISPYLQVFDLWENRHRQVKVSTLLGNENCPTCKQGQFKWLSGELGSESSALCGRNAVQLSFTNRAGDAKCDLDSLESRLTTVGTVTRNKFFLRLDVGDHVLTLFPDGRAIVKGTEEIAVAKRIYAQYIGN